MGTQHLIIIMDLVVAVVVQAAVQVAAAQARLAQQQQQDKKLKDFFIPCPSNQSPGDSSSLLAQSLCKVTQLYTFHSLTSVTYCCCGSSSCRF